MNKAYANDAAAFLSADDARIWNLGVGSLNLLK
jgi:hypothetical protein